MVIVYAEGDLLAAKDEALVNAVNTAGVMGKGLALQFREAFPDNYAAYRAACKAGTVHLGGIHLYRRPDAAPPRYVINFPTKRHWRSRSRLKDIAEGLHSLREAIRNEGIRTIAVPPLGCGHGGLRWEDVHPLITAALDDLPEVTTHVYAPQTERP